MIRLCGKPTLGSNSGLKFFDANGSGTYDGPDGVIAGWKVWLDNDADFSNGTLASTTTNAFGEYTFSNLGPGTYYVYEGAAVSGNWFQTMGGGNSVTGDPAPTQALGGTSGAYCITVSSSDDGGNDFGNLKELSGSGGKTMSLEGGLEEFVEFLRALASSASMAVNFSRNKETSCRNRAQFAQ